MMDPTVATALAVTELQIAALETATAASVADLLQGITGERPHVRIDIADPPRSPIATVAGVEATAATADEALVALGVAVAAQIRDIKTTSALVDGIADSIAAIGDPA
jgi:hypothetical protein